MTNTQKTTNEQQIKQLQAIVNQATAEEKLLSQKLAEDANTPVSFGERLSDKIATFGGSWTFISLSA